LKVFAIYLLSTIVCFTVIFYYKHTPAPVHTFVFKFAIGIPVLLFATAAMPLVLAISQKPLGPISHSRASGNVSLAVLVISSALMIKASAIHRPLEEHPAIAGFSDYLATQSQGNITAIDYEDHYQWPLIAGLMVELERLGIKSCTTWGHLDFIYTSHHICSHDRLPDYRIVSSSRCHGKCLVEAGGEGLISPQLPPINPGRVYPHDSNNLYFNGWYSSESTRRWTAGKASSIIFSADLSLHSYAGTLVIGARPLGTQNIKIALNSTVVYQGVLQESDSSIVAHFHPGLIADGINVISIDHPDGKRPGNGDPRTLAISLSSLEIK